MSSPNVLIMPIIYGNTELLSNKDVNKKPMITPPIIDTNILPRESTSIRNIINGRNTTVNHKRAEPGYNWFLY